MYTKMFSRSLAFVVVKNSYLKSFHQDEEYQKIGLECVQQTYDLLMAPDWKIEKVTKGGEAVVRSIDREGLGKIYKLTCRVKYPAKALCYEIFNKFENVPQWNPTVLKSTMIEKINNFTDITYNISAGYCGGIIKSRDFVNLRCCRLVVDGKISDENIKLNYSEEEKLKELCESSLSLKTDDDTTIIPQAIKDNVLDFTNSDQSALEKVVTDIIPLDLHKVLAKDNVNEDEQENLSGPHQTNGNLETISNKGRIWISAATSIDHEKAPITTEYIRGHNLVSGFVMHEVEGNPNECILEWIACVNFNGNIPRYALNMAFITVMSDYVKYVGTHIKELYQRYGNGSTVQKN